MLSLSIKSYLSLAHKAFRSLFTSTTLLFIVVLSLFLCLRFTIPEKIILLAGEMEWIVVAKFSKSWIISKADFLSTSFVPTCTSTLGFSFSMKPIFSSNFVTVAPLKVHTIVLVFFTSLCFSAWRLLLSVLFHSAYDLSSLYSSPFLLSWFD